MKILFYLLLLLVTPFLAYGTTTSASAKTELIDQQEIKQILDDYLVKQSNRLPHVELRFKSIKLPKSYRVPVGQIQHQVVPAKPRIVGSRRVTLMTRVDGQIRSNKSIRVEIEALAQIAVAAVDLHRGEIITATDIEFNYQDVSRINSPIFTLDEVIGKRLKRSVRLGQPLARKLVEFPPVIKRGDRVVIKAHSKGLLLTAAGKALEDGRTGETILVVNSNSGKEVLCRVVAPGQVEVEF